ncbi:MAG TPA: AAA family ATPase, partial [Candidatus Dormibacteraeota bacterium]|nr:AAA family ATPase [Candidatus Dormibacteraeota bacterium]
MLKELKVRDLALVAEATVRFGPGLNLLTGETGSGKSLLIDALSLALGARGGADQVRHGADRATVEAAFDGVVLQRELGKRSAARIDGHSSSPGQLKELGAKLVAIHGQHEHQALLDADTQTELLDAYAGAVDTRASVATAQAAWVKAQETLRDLEQMRSRGLREREYLRWQLEELRRADPQPGEDEALASERVAIRHAARLGELGQQAVDSLREDGVARAAAAMGAAAGLDPRLADHAARLEFIAEETSDVAAQVRRYVENLDADPRRLEAVEARLAELEAIKRKHGGSIESALQERQRLEIQLGATEDLEGALAAALAEAGRSRAELEAAAAGLTRARTAAARRMEKAVAAELQGL